MRFQIITDTALKKPSIVDQLRLKPDFKNLFLVTSMKILPKMWRHKVTIHKTIIKVLNTVNILNCVLHNFLFAVFLVSKISF